MGYLRVRKRKVERTGKIGLAFIPVDFEPQALIEERLPHTSEPAQHCTS
jgi:hypothetical protein